MTNTIEPTEEQKQAAATWLEDNDKCPPTETEAWDLAHLLAEREHKLRKENDDLRADVRTLLWDLRKIHRDQLQADLDAARAALRRAGYDDTTNVVPRLSALVDEAIAARARIAELERENTFLAPL